MKLKHILFISILLQGILMSATIKNITINNTKVPIIFDNSTNLPIFNLQLVFTNSGYIQDKNLSGVTNITAKLLNEGTLKDGAVKFAQKLENKAISINTSNGFETFVIELNSLKEQYPLALKLLKQLIQNPNISQNSLDKLKKLQISKIEQKQNDFDYLAQINLKKILWKDTPLQNPNMGTINSIKSIKLNDIQNKIKTLFNLDNLIIVAGGDIKFDELKQAITPIIKEFKPLGKTKLKHFKVNSKTSTSIIKKDTQQAYIYFGSAFNMDSKDKNSYKEKVASFILGGSGFGSRMMEKIRVQEGLVYSVYSYTSIQKSHSFFNGYLQTKLQNQTKAKNLVIQIIDDFIKNGATQKELDSAKQFLLGSQPLRTETFSQRQNRAFKLYYKGLPLDFPKKELKLIENLTLEDLNDFIKSHKEIKNLSFSILTK